MANACDLHAKKHQSYSMLQPFFPFKKSSYVPFGLGSGTGDGDGGGGGDV
jgi:hypothetical protein